jgi:hypothetical protein
LVLRVDLFILGTHKKAVLLAFQSKNANFFRQIASVFLQQRFAYILQVVVVIGGLLSYRNFLICSTG